MTLRDWIRTFGQGSLGISAMSLNGAYEAALLIQSLELSTTKPIVRLRPELALSLPRTVQAQDACRAFEHGPCRSAAIFSMGRHPRQRARQAGAAPAARLMRIRWRGATGNRTPVAVMRPPHRNSCPASLIGVVEPGPPPLDPEARGPLWFAGFRRRRRIPPWFAAHPPACWCSCPCCSSRSGRTFAMISPVVDSSALTSIPELHQPQLEEAAVEKFASTKREIEFDACSRARSFGPARNCCTRPFSSRSRQS